MHSPKYKHLICTLLIVLRPEQGKSGMASVGTTDGALPPNQQTFQQWTYRAEEVSEDAGGSQRRKETRIGTLGGKALAAAPLRLSRALFPHPHHLP